MKKLEPMQNEIFAGAEGAGEKFRQCREGPPEIYARAGYGRKQGFSWEVSVGKWSSPPPPPRKILVKPTPPQTFETIH